MVGTELSQDLLLVYEKTLGRHRAFGLAVETWPRVRREDFRTHYRPENVQSMLSVYGIRSVQARGRKRGSCYTTIATWSFLRLLMSGGSVRRFGNGPECSGVVNRSSRSKSR